MVVVGLLWHRLGRGNLGVDALTRTHIAIVSEAARRASCEIELVLFGNPTMTGSVIDVENVKFGARPSVRELLSGRSTFLSQARSCDLFIDIGEGDSFTDIYGPSRFAVQLFSKLAALRFRRPLVLAPQTVGPFDTWWARRLALPVLRRCDKIFARDFLSSGYVRSLGVASNVEEAIDVAFKLPYDPVQRNEGELIKVGVNVSGLLFRGGYTGSNQFGLRLNYADLTIKLIKHFSSCPDVEVWLVPHVISPGGGEDDLAICSKLVRDFPGVKLAPDFVHSSAAKTFIAGLDFLVAGRMHACIAAFSSGVPVVPIGYSRKFAGLFGTLGYSYLVDGRAMGTDEAFNFVQASFEERASASLAISRAMPGVLRRLQQYEDYLVELFSSVHVLRSSALL
ncbi:polysaccharide pyruvyl transferase family protein [Geminicoccus harenae]|uniref:polysaccharide pyruvyl transferase family protein n=1 Tax=Geminicoccus harenae TaxID=2498453 RepID=UPI00168BA5EE|nr:polysaccharide pyruvyl transferase family protein [Geminicoccus harenae]